MYSKYYTKTIDGKVITIQQFFENLSKKNAAKRDDNRSKSVFFLGSNFKIDRRGTFEA